MHEAPATLAEIRDPEGSARPTPMKHEGPQHTPITPQIKHQVRANPDKNNAQSLPSRLIGMSLYEVAERGDIEGVRAFLNTKVDINARGGPDGNPLHIASARGHIAVVRLLLEKGADVNAQGGPYRNALKAALFWRHGAVVHLLMDNGARRVG